MLGAYLHFNSETYKSNLFCLQVNNSDITFPAIIFSIKMTKFPSESQYTYIYFTYRISPFLMWSMFFITEKYLYLFTDICKYR